MLPARPHGVTATLAAAVRSNRHRRMDTAITIGNFDGVHLGHQALVQEARAEVGKEGRVVAITFDPHPMAVLRPGEAPPRLLPLRERVDRLKAAGADEVEVIDATKAFLATEATAFIEEIHRRLGFSTIVEGPRFRFGRGRGGSIELLKKLGERLRFRVRVVESIMVKLRDCSEIVASSSSTRWLLELGRVEDAALMMGRAHRVDGRVVRGQQMGRSLGFPTANVDHGEIMLPADGIYAAWAELPDASRRVAAVSVGRKPTFGRSERTCEAYILDFGGWREEYGWMLRLSFVAWMREQFRYDSVEELRAQIGRDVARIASMTAPPMEVTA